MCFRAKAEERFSRAALCRQQMSATGHTRPCKCLYGPTVTLRTSLKAKSTAALIPLLSSGHPRVSISSTVVAETSPQF